MSMRGRAFIVLLFAAPAIAGCGSSELHDRYVAERMFWRASREAQRLNLGQQVMRDEDLERARAAYAAIVKRFPPDLWASPAKRASRDGGVIAHIAAESMFREAELLASSNRQDEARRELAALRERFPKDGVAIRATYLEGLILRLQEKPGDAAAMVASIPGSHPATLDSADLPNEGVLEAPLVAARWYAEAGNADAARRALKDAEALYRGVVLASPRSRAALYSRVRLFTTQATMGEWEPAIRTMEEILADPGFQAEDREGRESVLGRLRIADIYAGPLQRPDEALVQIRGLLDGGVAADIRPRVHIIEARALSLAGRRPEALTVLAGVLVESPNDMDVSAQAYYARGAVYEEMGDWARALNEYRTLVRNYPRTQLGLAAPLEIVARYERVGDEAAGAAALARAIEDYRRVIELDPRSREAIVARQYMAAAYAAQEDWSHAATALGDVAEEAAGTDAGAEALWREAWIYEEKLGQIEEAEQRLRQIIASYPHSDAADRAQKHMDELSRKGDAR